MGVCKCARIVCFFMVPLDQYMAVELFLDPSRGGLMQARVSDRPLSLISFLFFFLPGVLFFQ